MAFDWLWMVFSIVILMAYTVQAITGFGSTVIALSIGVLWYSLDELLPFLIFSNILFSCVLVIKHKRHLNKYLAYRVVLPGMLMGLILGYLIKPYVDEGLLKQLLGLLIIWVSVLELWRLTRKSRARLIEGNKSRLLTLIAGLSHGLFASGGPLLVYTIAGHKVDKTQFRSTVVVCLFVLNCILSTAFLIDGRLEPVLPFVLAVIPIIFIAVKVGNYLHNFVNEESFKKGVFILLLGSGVNLVIGHHFIAN